MEATPTKTKTVLRKRDIAIIVVGVILVVIGLGWALDIVINKKPAPTVANKIASQSAKPYCPSGEVYENKKQGYKICLKKVDNVVDLSKTKNGTIIKVPLIDVYQATGSAKIATNSALRDSTSSVLITVEPISDSDPKKVNSKLDGIDAHETDSTTAQGSTSKVITAIVGKRFFTVGLSTEDKDFETALPIFRSLLRSFTFLANTLAPPWSDSGNVIVDEPWPGDSIANPVTVIGSAAAFEAIINIRIRDSAGNILINTTTNTAAGSILSGFNKVITYKTPTTNKGTVDIFTISAKDGTEQDKVSIPVVFAGK